MQVTEQGLDWDRVDPRYFDMVADYATEAARISEQDVCTARKCFYSRGDSHYTTTGGQRICPESAIQALDVANKYGTQLQRQVRAALDNSLGTTRSEAFDEHVRSRH
jgi:hypothetical protein